MIVSARTRRLLILVALFAFGCWAVWFWSARVVAGLGNPSWNSGWILLASILLPTVFNLRKRLVAFDLGRASTWLSLHVASGLAAVVLYLLHTVSVWPTGAYERLLALLFLAVTVTGVIGFVAQLVLPKRMTETGSEFVYENIPGEIFEIRENAQAAILAYTGETSRNLLSQHYDTSLKWFFDRPRFYWNHVMGGDKARAWLRTQMSAIRRFSAPDEMAHFIRIEELANRKLAVDRHYACQDILKRWLLLHLPLAVAFIVTAIWHIVLVHVYAS